MHTFERPPKEGDAQHTLLSMTTTPGLEAVVADEWRRKSAPAPCQTLPSGFMGRALIQTTLPPQPALGVARSMRSIHHIIEPLAATISPEPLTLDGLEAQVAASVPTSALLSAQTPFRVTANRRGTHPFTSEDVGRRLGAHFARHSGAPVNLGDPQIDLRIDIKDQSWTLGIQHTRTALSRRQQRPYNHPVSLRPDMAYAMLHTLGPDSPQTLADPFCGAGTILMEAASLWPDCQIWGSDWKRRAAQGAQANIEAMGLDAQVAIREADALTLSAHLAPHSQEAIVSNPPFGKRLGRGADYKTFFDAMLAQMERLLCPGGRAVLLIGRHGPFFDALKHRTGWQVRSKTRIHSGQRPLMVALERT